MGFASFSNVALRLLGVRAEEGWGQGWGRARASLLTGWGLGCILCAAIVFVSYQIDTMLLFIPVARPAWPVRAEVLQQGRALHFIRMNSSTVHGNVPKPTAYIQPTQSAQCQCSSSAPQRPPPHASLAEKGDPGLCKGSASPRPPYVRSVRQDP